MTLVFQHRHVHRPAQGGAINAALRADPTRTAVLRARFVRDMRRRLGALERDITTSIVDNDCFGLQPAVMGMFSRASAQLSPTRPKQFAFETDPAKIDHFMDWLREQQRAGILQIVRRPDGRSMTDGPWTDVYIDSAYQQGIRRARQELKRRGFPTLLADQTPGGIVTAFNQPIHAQTVAMLYGRTWEDLKTVMDVTNARLRRSLIDGLTTGLSRGLAEGKNPITIAREIAKSVNNGVEVIARNRAEMIARTEIIRAHHLANINEYREAAGEIDVEVMAEFATAGDDKVCEVCLDIESKNPYSLDRVANLIPVHPNCRCVALPVIAREQRMAA